MQVVVAAAIIRDARVLAAQRAGPPALAGQWEFPGGKVERHESEEDALIRECREELDVHIRVHKQIARVVIEPEIELALYTATIRSGEPIAWAAHTQLRWLGADEIESVDWLDVDRSLLAVVQTELAPY